MLYAKTEEGSKKTNTNALEEESWGTFLYAKWHCNAKKETLSLPLRPLLLLLSFHTVVPQSVPRMQTPEQKQTNFDLGLV